jgi:flavin reductase (DIM6/NTAB) family NADH-FMN oxidoreductase RutF
MTELSARTLRELFGLFATGVVVVTAVDTQGAPIGLTVNSLTSVSLDPPLLLWCLASTSQNRTAFTPAARFDIHILNDDQAQLAMHFARRAREKFETDAHWRSEPSPPRIHGALARISCRVQATHEAGDHVIIVGAIESAERGAGEPLVFHASKFGRFTAKVAAPDILPGSSDGWL